MGYRSLALGFLITLMIFQGFFILKTQKSPFLIQALSSSSIEIHLPTNNASDVTSFSVSPIEIHSSTNNASNITSSMILTMDKSAKLQYQYLHGLSALRAIVTGMEHTGTTYVSMVLFNTPCVMGAGETGLLLANTPADINKVDPWIKWHHYTDEIRRDKYYNLTDDEIEAMRQAKDFGEMFDILRNTSHLFNKLNDEPFCQKPSQIIDKTPRYVRPNYFEKILLKTPGTPVIVMQKSFKKLKESWNRRNSSGMTKQFYNQVYKNVENMMNKYPDRIMVVDYEKLMNEPVSEMENIFTFLDLEWDPNYLNMTNLKRKFSSYEGNVAEMNVSWKFKYGAHSPNYNNPKSKNVSHFSH